jgi:hypothetical protein
VVPEVHLGIYIPRLPLWTDKMLQLYALMDLKEGNSFENLHVSNFFLMCQPTSLIFCRFNSHPIFVHGILFLFYDRQSILPVLLLHIQARCLFRNTTCPKMLLDSLKQCTSTTQHTRKL